MKTGLDEKCQARRHEVCAWKWPLGKPRSMWKDVIKSIYKVVCQAVGVGTGVQLCSLARDVRHGALVIQRGFCRGTVFGKTILAQVLPWRGGGAHRRPPAQKCRCINLG
jgi:hypothetical protein